MRTRHLEFIRLWRTEVIQINGNRLDTNTAFVISVVESELLK
jgi:hypothetical protein